MQISELVVNRYFQGKLLHNSYKTILYKTLKSSLDCKVKLDNSKTINSLSFKKKMNCIIKKRSHEYSLSKFIKFGDTLIVKK